jgi:hypothetical protein
LRRRISRKLAGASSPNHRYHGRDKLDLDPEDIAHLAHLHEARALIASSLAWFMPSSRQMRWAWLLSEAGETEGRKATNAPTIKTPPSAMRACNRLLVMAAAPALYCRTNVAPEGEVAAQQPCEP